MSLELVLTATVSNGRSLSAQLKSTQVADLLRKDFPGSPAARTPRFHCREAAWGMQAQSLAREQRYHVPCDLTKKNPNQTKKYHPRHYVNILNCRYPSRARHNEISDGHLTETSSRACDPVFTETYIPHPQGLEV